MMTSQQTEKLDAALAKAQRDFKPPKFDKVNPHFKSKYASLAATIDAIRQSLASNGISVTQVTTVNSAGFFLVTRLAHDGQWIAGEYPLPGGLDPQKTGSALTYARRYALSAITCIAADDDDDAEATNGRAATGTVQAAINPAAKEWAEKFREQVKAAATIEALEKLVTDSRVMLNKLAKDSEPAHTHVMGLVIKRREALTEMEPA